MRIGIDLGGTKIEAALLGAGSQVLHRERVATPRGDYPGALVANADADCSILVMDAHGDHCPLEPRVADAWHREQELARQEAWCVHEEENAPRAKWLQGPALRQ